MKYKRGKRFGLSHVRQSYIYFTCLSFATLSARERDRILARIQRAGGDYWQALFDAVTTEMRLAEVSAKYDVSESTLVRRVSAFYRRF